MSNAAADQVFTEVHAACSNLIIELIEITKKYHKGIYYKAKDERIS
jgi:hypothetical protein